MTESEILGREIAKIWVDEFAGKIWATSPVVIAVYDEPDYPEARIEVHEISLLANDPRNPNPAAGAVKRFVVVTNGRASREIKSIAVAKLMAKATHERLIGALEKAKLDQIAEERAIPGYGAF